MKKIVLLFVVAALGQSAKAQISITTSSLVYTQNFDGLDTASGISSANLPSGWSIFEFGTSLTTVDNKYKSGDGSSNAGDTYSFGTSGSNERALGSIASGSNTPSYGAKFINNTGANIIAMKIRFRVEQWRFGGPTASRPNVDSVRFLYSTTASGLSDTLAIWKEDTSLMMKSPNYTGSTATALDGNAAGNNYILSHTDSVTIANGGTIVLKWLDKNIFGNDDGLAVDSFSVTFVTGPVGINNVSKEALPVTVIGHSTSQEIKVAFTAPANEMYVITVTDLTGRTIRKEEFNAVQGINRLSLNGLNIPGGLYIIKVGAANSYGVAKAMVQ